MRNLMLESFSLKERGTSPQLPPTNNFHFGVWTDLTVEMFGYTHLNLPSRKRDTCITHSSTPSAAQQSNSPSPMSSMRDAAKKLSSSTNIPALHVYAKLLSLHWECWPSSSCVW